MRVEGLGTAAIDAEKAGVFVFWFDARSGNGEGGKVHMRAIE